jgi:cell wall-associated NlpC family hydrolase
VATFLGVVAVLLPAAGIYAAHAGDAKIFTSDGHTVIVHTAPSLDAPKLQELASGTPLKVAHDPETTPDGRRWSQVQINEGLGYVEDDFLANDLIDEGGGHVTATHGNGLNVRLGPGMDRPALFSLAEGTPVYMTGGRQRLADNSDWDAIRFNGQIGWARQDFLAWGPGPEVAAAPSAPTAPPQTSGTGQQIAGEAVRLLGIPYVWGGTSPAGFDCSGFTSYVLNQVVGNFPREMYSQAANGAEVGINNLLPGDVIFFADTYQPGLSHVGIYTGEGQFVNAANPGTGVTMSNLFDGYWSQHFAFAKRIA